MGDTMYDLNKINDCLNTKKIGQTIIQYEELTSTYLKSKNIFGTCPDGAVILSEKQTKWTVRMGQEWVCHPERNIYLSIILKPLVNNHLTSKFDVIGCAALCEALNNLYNIDCKIKWPNDILARDKKVSSVNSSLVVRNNRPEGIIISFGINTNISMEEIESCDGIKEIATSLFHETSGEVDREELIAEILNNIEKYYEETIDTGSVQGVLDIFRKDSVIINKDIEVRKKGKKTSRKVYAKDINAEGLLVVINEKGNEEILSPGEIVITYEKDT